MRLTNRATFADIVPRGISLSRSEDLCIKCDEEIRAGRVAEAAKKLSALTPSQIPRPEVLHLANLCRRTALTELGLKILTPVVRPLVNGKSPPATGAELSEFAILLDRVGAVADALSLLEN